VSTSAKHARVAEYRFVRFTVRPSQKPNSASTFGGLRAVFGFFAPATFSLPRAPGARELATGGGSAARASTAGVGATTAGAAGAGETAWGLTESRAAAGALCSDAAAFGADE
jgi:hypothetical protein